MHYAGRSTTRGWGISRFLFGAPLNDELQRCKIRLTHEQETPVDLLSGGLLLFTDAPPSCILGHMQKKWTAPKIVGLVIGIPLCLVYFGFQFLFAGAIVGAVIVWDLVSESGWYRDWHWEHRRQRLLRKAQRASASGSGGRGN